jgi:acetyl esterase/lipase
MRMPPTVIAYREIDQQVGDLYLPGRGVHDAPVVCLLHGGFWRMPYARDEMHAVAEDLAARGFAVWNLEYRRLGGGGGWPATVDDVRAGIDHLATLRADGLALDLRRVAVAGHSAGGHLALCCAHRDDRYDADGTPRRVPVIAAVGLAPVADLAYAHTLSSGGGAVTAFLGAAPEEQPRRYRNASPIERLPLGVRQLILHGTADDVLPIEISRRYAQAALAAGDDLTLVELENCGHMEFLDPTSRAHAALCEWLNRVLA